MIKNIPQFQRPREKLIEKGASALSLEELWMCILGRGTKGNPLEKLVQILMKSAEEQWGTLSISQISSMKGIGKVHTCSILAVLEIGKRLFGPRDHSKIYIQETKDILMHVSDIVTARQEHFLCFYLNARLEILEKRTVSIGTLTMSLVHPRDVLAPAMNLGAHGIIVVHNHPSGSLESSLEDIRMTERLKAACELLGIVFHEHVIVSREGWARVTL